MAKISIDQAYDSEPWWYDARGFLILTFAYQSTLPAQIRFFSKNIGVNHLEVAIGSGTFFNLILKWRKWKGLVQNKIVGFDYADQMLEGARRRFLKIKNIELIKADAAHLPFVESLFDTANIANALHCLPEISPSLSEIHRVLKPEGTLAGNCLLYPRHKNFFDTIATRINNWGMQKGILQRPYLKEEIQKLIQDAGFVIIYEKTTGNCYDFIAMKK